MDDPDLTRLPKWAQQYVRDLRSERDLYRTEAIRSGDARRVLWDTVYEAAQDFVDKQEPYGSTSIREIVGAEVFSTYKMQPHDPLTPDALTRYPKWLQDAIKELREERDYWRTATESAGEPTRTLWKELIEIAAQLASEEVGFDVHDKGLGFMPEIELHVTRRPKGNWYAPTWGVQIRCIDGNEGETFQLAWMDDLDYPTEEQALHGILRAAKAALTARKTRIYQISDPERPS